TGRAIMFPDITRRREGAGVVVSDELLEDLEHGRGLTEAAISDRTRAAYTYEFDRFAKWAERHKLASLPTTPAIAATYLAHLSKRGALPATLAIVRAAIKHHHATLPPRAKGRNHLVDAQCFGGSESDDPRSGAPDCSRAKLSVGQSLVRQSFLQASRRMHGPSSLPQLPLALCPRRSVLRPVPRPTPPCVSHRYPTLSPSSQLLAADSRCRRGQMVVPPRRVACQQRDRTQKI